MLDTQYQLAKHPRLVNAVPFASLVYTTLEVFGKHIVGGLFVI